MNCLKIAVLALCLHVSLSHAMDDMCPAGGNPNFIAQRTLFEGYVIMTAATLKVGYEKKMLSDPTFIGMSAIMVAGCVATGAHTLSTFMYSDKNS